MFFDFHFFLSSLNLHIAFHSPRRTRFHTHFCQYFRDSPMSVHSIAPYARKIQFELKVACRCSVLFPVSSRCHIFFLFRTQSLFNWIRKYTPADWMDTISRTYKSINEKNEIHTQSQIDTEREKRNNKKIDHECHAAEQWLVVAL